MSQSERPSVGVERAGLVLGRPVASVLLLAELEENISSGQCGIMIHHQRMNEKAFELLDMLLAVINASPQLSPVLFSEL